MPEHGGQKQKEATDAAPITHVTATLDHTLVSSDATKPSRKRLKLAVKQWDRRRKLLVTILVTVLLAGAGLGIYAWVHDEPDPTIRDVKVTSEGVVLRQLDQKALQTEVEKLSYQKKYNSAVELINYQHNVKDKEVQMLLATTYMNQEKHQDALNVLLALDKSGADWKVTRNIGTEYERLSDKAQAQTYYKKALDQLQKADNVPVKDDEIFFLQQDIKRVGG